jgi:hypothetical protein
MLCFGEIQLAVREDRCPGVTELEKIVYQGLADGSWGKIECFEHVQD